MKVSCRPCQLGFAALAAVFLIVGLATLGAVMLTVSNTQQLTSAQDFQGSRAYWAAQGGLEWAIASVVASAPVAPAVAPAARCPGPDSAPPVRLEGFALAVACTRLTYEEGGVDVTIFHLTSVASTPDRTAGSLGFIERSVSASVER